MPKSRPSLEACRKGGQNVPREKRSYYRDSELARICGAKGGKSVPAERRSFSVNPELARSAARKSVSARKAKISP